MQQNEMTQEQMAWYDEVRGHTAAKKMVVDMNLENKSYEYLVDNARIAVANYGAMATWDNQILMTAYLMAINTQLANAYDAEYQYNQECE